MPQERLMQEEQLLLGIQVARFGVGDQGILLL
jgi:hypothetical protein